MKEFEVDRSSYIANCIFNAFTCYAAIMLNSVTIHALTKTPSLPKPLKTLLLSLALSDLGVGIVIQPLFIAVTVMDLKEKVNTEETLTFVAYQITLNIFSIVSFFGVMALSVDRFLAVHLHLRYQELVTHKRVIAVVIIIWVVSVFCSLRLLIPVKVTYMITAIIASLCLLISTLLYYKIYVAVRLHANRIQALQVQQAAQDGRMENAASLKKFAIGTFFVYLAFLVCYLPRFCTLIIVSTSEENATTKVLRVYTVTLVLLNSSLNPLIYCWKMRHVRHAVINILRNLFQSHN